MFRRKTQPATTSPQPAKPGGKGRPTPSRKEAEAAARARAKVPRTRKEQMAAERAKRTESSRKIRQAMKDGDERYFMPRDKGPVRRFIRDLVDTRFSFIELTVPVMLVTLVLGYSGNQRLAGIGNLVLVGMFLLIVVDVITLRFRLRRELARRFPDQPLKGTTWYGLSRSMSMRFMRLPKPQVRIGQQLPEHYR